MGNTHLLGHYSMKTARGHFVNYQRTAMPLRSRDITTAMDATQKSNSDYIVNFNLLTDDFELIDSTNNCANAEDIPDSIMDLLDSIGDGDPQKKDADYQAFEEESQSKHFQPVTNEDLDKIVSEINATTTHWQTNWAVNVLRGTL